MIYYNQKGQPTELPDWFAPESVQASPPRSVPSEFARRLGLAGVAVPNEAMGELSPGEMAAIESNMSGAGNSDLIRKLATIFGIFFPPALIPAMAAKERGGEQRGSIDEIIKAAGGRAVTKRTEKYRDTQEGLMPSEGAVPGYMSVGEARGVTAGAAEDRATAATEKMITDLRGSVKPLFDAYMAGQKLTPEQLDRLDMGLSILQGMVQRPMEVAPWSSATSPSLPKLGRGGARPKEKGPQKIPGRVMNNGKIEIYLYDDGKWRDATGKAY